MKEIRYSTQFTRHYKQRIARVERLIQDFQESVDAFQEDRTFVDDHPLEDVMEGQRSFSINNEYRVVYVETDDLFVFLDIGTHEQVYRRSQ